MSNSNRSKRSKIKMANQNKKMAKTVTITFSTQDEKDAAIAESKEKFIECSAKHDVALAELENATIA